MEVGIAAEVKIEEGLCITRLFSFGHLSGRFSIFYPSTSPSSLIHILSSQLPPLLWFLIVCTNPFSSCLSSSLLGLCLSLTTSVIK